MSSRTEASSTAVRYTRRKLRACGRIIPRPHPIISPSQCIKCWCLVTLHSYCSTITGLSLVNATRTGHRTQNGDRKGQLHGSLPRLAMGRTCTSLRRKHVLMTTTCVILDQNKAESKSKSVTSEIAKSWPKVQPSCPPNTCP